MIHRRGLHRRPGDVRRLDHLDHVHIVARSHFACASPPSDPRTDSRVTAVVAASAAMVVATIPLTVPRRSLLGCRSVPAVPHRTHVRTTLLSRENLTAIDYAARRRRAIQRDIIIARSLALASRLVSLGALTFPDHRTIFPSRCAKKKLPARAP